MAEAWPLVVARYHLGKSSKLSEIIGFFRKNHQPFNQALDIGTGTGALALAYKTYATTWDYLEIDEQVAKQASQLLGQEVSTSWAEVETKSFDLITVVDTFFYFSEPQETINKLEAMLNPNGKLVITLTDTPDHSWVSCLRNYLNLGRKARGFTFEETKENFLRRFSPSIWGSVYFHKFSYPAEEAILLFMDWLDQCLNSKNKSKIMGDKLTNITDAKNGRLWLLRLTWPIFKLVSFLDYPFRPFLSRYRFIVVLTKKISNS